MGGPSLSVVITTRNSARTLARCLDSLLPYYEQGHIAEIVVVDGNSRDQTVEIARAYQATLLLEDEGQPYQDSIIRAHHSKYHALDMGWQHTRGDLVVFLDSDAYLGEGFFPAATAFFADEELGVLGCWAKAWVTNRVTKTLGEAWQFHAERVERLQRPSVNALERLYAFAAWFGAKGIPASGPCYIVRRACLERVGGHDILGDVGLSLRIVEAGWKSLWWVESPVYHLPKESLRQLARQRFFWGQAGAFMPGGGWRRHLAFPFRIAGATTLGLFLSMRFRNAWHVLTLPVAELSHLAGYLAGLLARARGKR
jgi:cellulose synthase/poly-beta-1,6-N-acetylglucosamine synthase-like glycosyltransferase